MRACFCGSIPFGRPMGFPSFRAQSMPATTRSRIISNSNSAKLAKRFNRSLPKAVVVSKPSWLLRNPM